MSNLTEQLKAQADESAQKYPEDVKSVMNAANEELAQSEILSGTLKVGDQAPDFELTNHKGDQVKLSEQLKDGPVVLSFYRGGWCPYCNLELKALQTKLPEIQELQAKLLAVSPEKPDNTLSTFEKNELQFQVLSDSGNQASRDFGLVFKMPPDLIDLYSNFNLNIDERNGDDSWELPLPATYLIGQDGLVKYAFVNTDYKLRAEPDKVIQELRKLSTSS
jgi:peroxiredoxin